MFFSWSSYGQLEEPIKILSWNVFLRPGFLADNQLGRVDSIGAYLNTTEADVLVLQEVFHRRSRRRLVKKLNPKYPYHTKFGKTSLLGVSSGVVIFSKTKIIKEKHVYFKHAIKADQLAKKGGVLAVISVNGKSIDVVGTHLQAGGGEKGAEIRQKQISRLKSLPTTLHRPTFFVGDFNIHRQSEAYRALVNKLNCENSTPEGKHRQTANFDDQDLMKASGKPKWIDFILSRKTSRAKIQTSYIEQPMITINGEDQRLSDHNPIISIISRD